MKKTVEGFEMNVWVALNCMGGNPVYGDYVYKFLDTKKDNHQVVFNKTLGSIKTNKDELVKLALTVNHIGWVCHEDKDEEMAKRFFDFYYELENVAYKNLSQNDFCDFQRKLD